MMMAALLHVDPDSDSLAAARQGHSGGGGGTRPGHAAADTGGADPRRGRRRTAHPVDLHRRLRLLPALLAPILDEAGAGALDEAGFWSVVADCVRDYQHRNPRLAERFAAPQPERARISRV
jgi:hypothetical protein